MKLLAGTNATSADPGWFRMTSTSSSSVPADRNDVFDPADRARERLGSIAEVNATVVSRKAWQDGSSPFLEQVQRGTLVPLALDTAQPRAGDEA